MGDNFYDWASVYFAEGSWRLDKELVKDDVFQDCKAQANITKLTPNIFTRKLKSFVSVADWLEEFNPKSGKDGRIKKNCIEYIYLKSKDAAF